jgi:hypothetical protein
MHQPGVEQESHAGPDKDPGDGDHGYHESIP